MTKKRNKDPHAKREAKKYENPIPSREFIMGVLKDYGRLMSYKQLVDKLALKTEDERDALRYRLRAMERDGQVMRSRRGLYGLIKEMELIKGRVVGHPDGYGFVIPDEGGDDLYLSYQEMRAIFHGDRVLVREIPKTRAKKREGSVVEVLERNTKQVVGRLFGERGVYYVVPDVKRISHEIVIPKDEIGDAKHGQIVVAAITEPPSRRRQAIGSVIEVLGEHMAPGMEIEVAINSYGIPLEWPDAVTEHVADLKEEVLEVDKKDRTDLRDLPLVTIDGEDAKDFDDAVYCERKGKNWRLLVAIADVSHYVRFDSALDAEAKNRGNSVYFPGRVIPMLPEILSNGLCSLKPKVDRLCMVCDLSISPEGKLQRYRFYDAVMHSHARLTYSQVAKALDGDAATQDKVKDVLPQLEDLHALYKILHKQREQRGAIDLDIPETRIVFGDEKKIKKIVPVMRNDAHKIIEECMLMANVAAASFVQEHKIPNLYRVHGRPNEEKLEALREFLGELGLGLRGGKEPAPKDFSHLLADISDRPDRHLIQIVLLRSLTQAVYSPENNGHFALAFPAYAHFTSPIRRYPDLLLHRAIRHVLEHQEVKEFYYDTPAMERLGEQCSTTERRADEATRDVTDWLKCEYMLDRVGEEFDGVISSVTSFGLFIELKDIYVEGLLHISGLKNDYYHFDPVKHRLTGERSGTAYRLGDTIRVQVARVDLDDKKIDFEFVE